MNIVLGLFVDQFKDRWSIGAHFQSPIDGTHHFFGEVAADEESVIMALMERLDHDFEELGMIEFITTTTKYLNFLCRGESKNDAPSAQALKACLRKINSTKGSKYKKNESPDVEDVLFLSYADMMNSHMQRHFELTGKVSLDYTDSRGLTKSKKSYKKVPHIFLAPKLFNWGPTEEVTLTGEPHTVYYVGNVTPKNDTSKKDNNASEFEKLLRGRLYTYYTGSNSLLTDAGQRSLEEIRSVTLVNEKHPVIERFFEIQEKGIKHLPVRPVYTARLDKIIGSASSQALMDPEMEHWFGFNKDSGDVTFNGVTRSDISYVFYPQRLGPRIRNQFINLKDKFIAHLEGNLIGEEIDITDELYDYTTNAKGKVTCAVKPVLNGKFNFIKIPKLSFDGHNFTLKYVFNLDAPHTNMLKNLVKFNPRVSLVFENLSDTTIGYYTIVRTDIGVSIHSCPEGSRLVRRKR